MRIAGLRIANNSKSEIRNPKSKIEIWLKHQLKLGNAREKEWWPNMLTNVRR